MSEALKKKNTAVVPHTSPERFDALMGYMNRVRGSVEKVTIQTVYKVPVICEYTPTQQQAILMAIVVELKMLNQSFNRGKVLTDSQINDTALAAFKKYSETLSLADFAAFREAACLGEMDGWEEQFADGRKWVSAKKVKFMPEPTYGIDGPMLLGWLKQYADAKLGFGLRLKLQAARKQQLLSAPAQELPDPAEKWGEILRKVEHTVKSNRQDLRNWVAQSPETAVKPASP